jgi:hypothetical protein
MTMNERCPACGMAFSREAGYFLGAMYFSYAIAVPLLAVLTGAVWLLVPGWELHWAVLPAVVAFLPFVPLVFRYSRILWIHLDRAMDPGEP